MWKTSWLIPHTLRLFSCGIHHEDLRKKMPAPLAPNKTIAAFNIHSQIPLHNLRSVKPCFPPLSTSSFFSCRSSHPPDRNSQNIYAYRTVNIPQPATVTALSPLFGSNSTRRKFVIPQFVPVLLKVLFSPSWRHRL